MSIAFVFSGGASLGSIHVGMAQALAAGGIKPDIVFGTSVGALNGAFIAGGGSPDELGVLWRSLKRRDLFPVRPLTGLRGFIGRAPHFVQNEGIRRLLRQNLTFARLEEAPLPLTVLATDAQTGAEVVLSHGPAIEAIMASAAIPGVLPPIKIGGRMLIDGGVVNNTPITTAIEAGATEVWVLSTGYSCALPAAPSTPFGLAMHAVALLVQQRLQIETQGRSYPVPVRLIPPPCPITVTPIDFSQTDRLIEAARAGTAQWLANGMPHALPLVPHQHR